MMAPARMGGALTTGVTQKIPGELMGLALPVYVHMTWDKTRRVDTISYFAKGRVEPKLEKLLFALSHITTAMIHGDRILGQTFPSFDQEAEERRGAVAGGLADGEAVNHTP